MANTTGQVMPDGSVQYYEDAMGRAMVSTDYDPTSSYAVGDYCIYDNVRYCCNTAIASGGETWNSAHWDVAKVDDDITEIKSSLSNLIKSQAFSGTTNNDGNLVFSELSPANIIAIGVVTSDLSRIWRFGVSGSGKLIINFSSTANTALNNQPVSGTLYYIEP